MDMRIPLAATVFSLALAGGARADCYADYKAKREPPLQLAYGVAQVPQSACGSTADAAAALAPRLAAAGWTLLSVVSLFGPDGLDERKASAGDQFLRY